MICYSLPFATLIFENLLRVSTSQRPLLNILNLSIVFIRIEINY